MEGLKLDAPRTVPVKYAIRKRGTKQKAHIWIGHDTVCRMWSTGGLRKKGYAFHDGPGNHDICHMCKLGFDAMKI